MVDHRALFDFDPRCLPEGMLFAVQVTCRQQLYKRSGNTVSQMRQHEPDGDILRYQLHIQRTS